MRTGSDREVAFDILLQMPKDCILLFIFPDVLAFHKQRFFFSLHGGPLNPDTFIC